VFQKRHYEAIAEIIREADSSAFDVELSAERRVKNETIAELRRDFGRMFIRDNPNFDLDRFNRACDSNIN
jgi:hypothetical protein